MRLRIEERTERHLYDIKTLTGKVYSFMCDLKKRRANFGHIIIVLGRWPWNSVSLKFFY